MAKVKIQGNASGAGIFTITPPATATDRTLTLPDATGTLINTAPSTSGYVLTSDGTNWTSAAAAGGGVLQVKSITKTDKITTTSSSWSGISGLSIAITPTSTSNKILIMVSVNSSSGNGTNAGGGFRIYRNSSNLSGAHGDASSNRTTMFSQATSGSSSWVMHTSSLVYLDAPSSTSAQTYQIYWRAENTTSGSILNSSYEDADSTDRPRGASTITVMEIDSGVL